MRCPTTARWCSIAIASLVLFCSLSLRSYAQPCNCIANWDKDVDICVGGTTYTIHVYLCDVVYGVPHPPGYCTGLGQNRISRIRKICFPGLIPPGTNKDIISAMYCAIYNLDCASNVWGVTVPMTPGSRYCWQIQAPKCTTRDVNNCIVPCGSTCKWCYAEFAWTRFGGNCPKDVPVYCSDDGDCDQGCEQGCPTAVCCD